MDITLEKPDIMKILQLKVDNLLPADIENGAGSGQLILEAVSNNETLGAMYFEDRGQELELMSIAVKPEYQRKRIGTNMLACFFKSLYYSNIKPVHCYYIDEPDNAFFDSFINNCGFFYTEQTQKLYTISPKKRRNSENYKRLASAAKTKCVLWCNLQEGQKNAFRKNRIMEGDYIFHGIDEKTLDDDLCFCRLDSLGEITAAAFMQRRDDKRYALAYVYSKNPAGFSEVLGNTLSTFEVYGAMASLEVVAANERTERMIEKLFPEGIDKQYIIDAEWNYSINSERNEEV